MSCKLALHVIVTFTEQVVPIQKHISLFRIAFISETKTVTMKLTKIAVVKLSDHPPIPHLLSALCKCTVRTCRELVLSKASVRLTSVTTSVLFKVFKRVSWRSFRVSAQFSLLCLILLNHIHKNTSFRPNILNCLNTTFTFGKQTKDNFINRPFHK